MLIAITNKTKIMKTKQGRGTESKKGEIEEIKKDQISLKAGGLS